MKKILIIGSNGFIGKNLIQRLNHNENKIFLIDKSLPSKSDLSLLKKKKIHFQKVDITKTNNFNKISKINFDVVYHLASVVGVSQVLDPKITIDTIINGSLNIIKKVIKKNTLFIFFSTSEAYGNNPKLPWREEDSMVLGSYKIPRWNYAKSKSLIESVIYEYSKKIKFKYIILRLFNIYGPHQSNYFITSSIINRCLNNLPCYLNYPGTQTRCFTYIDDLNDFLIKILKVKNIKSGVFNIGNNKRTKVKNLIKLIIKLTKSKSKIKIKKFSTVKKTKMQDVIHRQPDISKIYKFYKWKPKTNLANGLKKTISFFK